MVAKIERGLFVVSIDTEVHASPSLDRQRSIRRAVPQIEKLVREYHLAATWSTVDPATTWLHDELPRDGSHELTLQADAHWRSRACFAHELQSRVERARALGVPVSSLVWPDVSKADHLDILIKQKLTVVRRAAVPVNWALCAMPAKLRYGLWSVPPTLSMPGTHSWRGDLALRLARQGLSRAAKRQQVCHLVINGEKFALEMPQSTRSLESILCMAAELCESNQLVAVTLAQVAGQLAKPRTSEPTRSILRAA